MAKRRGITKRKDGRYQAIIDLGYEEGKRRRKYVYADTEREVIRKKRDIEAQIHAGVLPTRGDMTVAAMMEEWLEREVRGRLRRNTVLMYECMTRRHIVPALGDLRLSKVDTYTVQVFLDDVCGKRKNLSPRTVDLIRSTLKSAWKVAVDWEWAGRNPVEKTRPPKRDAQQQQQQQRSRLPMVSVRDAQRIARACLEYRNPLSVMPAAGRVPFLMLYTGLRINEALSLRWQLIDLAEGEMEVRDQLEPADNGGWRFAPLKTTSSQSHLRLHEDVIQMLREQREEQRLLGRIGDMDLVFTGRRGGPLSDSVVRQAWKTVLADLSIPYMRLHDIRHIFISLLGSLGTPLRDWTEAARHANLSTTQLYSHSLPGSREKTARAIGDLLGGRQ